MFDKDNPFKLLLISLAGTVFILYTDIVWIPWRLVYMKEMGIDVHTFFLHLAIRSIYYVALIFMLLRVNLNKISTLNFLKRLWYNALICTFAFVIFAGLSFMFDPTVSHLGSIVLFQFFVVCILSTLTGHIFLLYSVQRKKEQEIEQLKIENLQSRCDALTNQINPHFFFNSLNGLSALIRKKNDDNTLAYINTLSDVFRYILQSEKKGLVSLEEELEFVRAFRYMLEVRYANKLIFDIDIAEGQIDLKIPVLSLLPLMDNIIVHNSIDSDHLMEITIRLNKQSELVISNPIFPKMTIPYTNGTGIRNLENRFLLLLNKRIRVENDGKVFTVVLPLK